MTLPALGLVGLATFLSWAQNRGPSSLVSAISARYPEVPWVSPEELEDLIEKESPTLLDVRTQAEFEVSHIPGAFRVEPEGSIRDLPGDVPLQEPVVVYCSVGYRSADWADRLHRARGIRARNLSGGIFEWANTGRPMEDGEGHRTPKVHPYDQVWGQWVREEVRAELE